jgi:TatD DNase family protein
VQAALGQRHPELALAFGLHPLRVGELDDAAVAGQLAALEQALFAPSPALPRPHAVGELGLDGRPAAKSCLPRQASAFRAQLALARAANLPLVLHIVRCHGEALRILQRDGIPQRGGVVHSYSGSAEQVSDYLRLGLYISFSPAITAPQSPRLAAAARAVPIDRLLVETDAPDQTPYSLRPQQNEPAFLAVVLTTLAALRQQPLATVAAATADNARQLFGLAQRH